MQDREFEKANSDFFEAFKSFDEAGSPARIRCLKYVVLSNMLMKAKINPFDSPEAKPYKVLLLSPPLLSSPLCLP